MTLRVKITPRVTVPVARRLRLAAGLRSSSMSAVVNEVLDQALPSLDEIRAKDGAPQPGVPVEAVPNGRLPARSGGVGTVAAVPRRRGPGEVGWWLRGAAV